MTSARIRNKRRNKPSAPRQIGANDNAPMLANDNDSVVVSGVTLRKDQARRFHEAVSDEASADLDRRRSGRNAMVALEAEIADVIGEARRRADLDETVALETTRGSVIETSTIPDQKGRKRIASRDGLETLMTAKSLTGIQYAAGLRYRADYEAIDPEKGLTPPSPDQARTIVRGGDGYAQKRREIEERVRDMEAMIQEEDRSFRGANGRTALERVGRAVFTLREVAGKGSNLSDLSSNGSTRALNSLALMVGLDCAAIAYGLE